MTRPRIEEAPLHRRGYYEARPRDLLGRDDIVLVDIREEAELTSHTGHIEGVLHVPEAELLRRGAELAPDGVALGLVCDRGHRSADCAAQLVERWGLAEVYVLVGGMNRWNAEECPTSTRPKWKRVPGLR